MILTKSQRATDKPKRNVDQRFNRLTVLSLVLVGMLGVAAAAFFFFDVKLLTGQLGALVALGAVGVFLVGQFIRFREKISLRTLLILVAVLAVGLAYVGRRMADAQAESDAISVLLEGGAYVRYRPSDEPDHEDFFETDDGWLLPVWMRDWMGESYFSNVRNLDFRGSEVEDRHLPLLSDVRRLRFLGLAHSQITADGIANMPLVPGVEHVVMDWKQLTLESAARLRQMKELKAMFLRFEDLDLAPTATRPPTDLTLLQGFQALDRLAVQISTVDAESMRVLAKLPKLQRLSIGSGMVQTIDDVSAMALLGESQTIRHLSIGVTEFGDAELKALEGIGSLQTLGLGSTSVTPDGVRAFHAARPNVAIVINPPIPGLDLTQKADAAKSGQDQ